MSPEMPNINSRSLVKTILVAVLIVSFTALLNIIQIVFLSLSLRNDFVDWNANLSVEVREEIIRSSVDDLQALSKSLETPMAEVLFSVIGQRENSTGIATTVKYSAEFIEDMAPLIAEVSLLNKDELIIDALHRNLPSIVLNAGKLDQAISALNRVNWSSVPLLQEKGIVLESKTSLISDVWGKNYQSIGSWTSLLGANQPKRYFVALQNSAQARGTGGMPGTFAIIELVRGKVNVLRTGTNAELRSAASVPIDVPDEFSQIYGNYPANWNPSNLSPHFPYAAQIWLALWKAQTGETLDGAIAVDPFVLASMLEATGEIEVYGKVLRSNNTVEELLSNSYKEYEFDNQKRKNFLAEVALTFGRKLQQDSLNSRGLLSSLLEPLSENRVLIYSKEKVLQEILEEAAISGSLNYRNKNDFRAIVLNTSGNKMDFYLERKLSIETLSCRPNKTKVTFDLYLNIDPNEKLSDYVNGRRDLGLTGGVGNRHGIAVLIFGPKGSSIIVEESDIPKNYLSELGRPVWLQYADLSPRMSQQFKVIFSGGKGSITTSTQPLVKPQKISITDSCRR